MNIWFCSNPYTWTTFDFWKLFYVKHWLHILKSEHNNWPLHSTITKPIEKHKTKQCFGEKMQFSLNYHYIGLRVRVTSKLWLFFGCTIDCFSIEAIKYNLTFTIQSYFGVSSNFVYILVQNGSMKSKSFPLFKALTLAARMRCT